MRFLRSIVAALFLGAGLVAVPAAAPPLVAGVGPLPDCELIDILTIPAATTTGPSRSSTGT